MALRYHCASWKKRKEIMPVVHICKLPASKDSLQFSNCLGFPTTFLLLHPYLDMDTGQAPI
jgi:hypothetical protein